MVQGNFTLGDNKIIEEATEAIANNLDAGCYVEPLLRIVRSQKAEIDRLNYAMERDASRHNEELESKSKALSAIWDLNEEYLAKIRSLEAEIEVLKREKKGERKNGFSIFR